MPLYDYDCAACGRRVEVIHGVNAPGPTHCPNCGGGPLKKAIVAAAVHYKGSGWAKKERRAAVGAGARSSDGDASSGDGEAKPGESSGEKPAAGGEGPTDREGASGGADATSGGGASKPGRKGSATGTATKAD